MPEFFLELFSEEIPARMQSRAAADLVRLVTEALAPLSPSGGRGFHGPRRIAMVTEIAAAVAAATSSERGPRLTAPQQALAGFLRKHGAAREQLRQEGEFWVLDKSSAAVSPAALIAGVMPGLLRRFPWPKSMRWGATSAFTWVRPLRRILCLVDGEVVPFDLRDGDDDGHGLAASNLTEGHRFHAPGPVAVSSRADWMEKLRQRRVRVDADERKRLIADAAAGLAAERGAVVVDDPGLLEEVAGLVEWPVAMIGRIDSSFMDLPPEVMQVSMRVNQRYFSLRNTDGSAAPYFAFAANIEATDGGAAIVAGNERVLRARFSDARHFWDLDRGTTLESLVPRLDQVTFHAKLGSQGDRVRRLRRLVAHVAPLLGADTAQAVRAAELCKADLLTGMVGEFPELQGLMGGYYACHDREPPAVSDAIRNQYNPKGPNDATPLAPVASALALADKLDQLAGFFANGERPTGSGDPYALRRAALGVIRILREGGHPVRLHDLISAALDGFDLRARTEVSQDILEFIVQRLLVQFRAEGRRHDVLAAVFATPSASGPTDVIPGLLGRADSVADFLATGAGSDLLTAYRRAANILRIEARKDGPHNDAADRAMFVQPEEPALAVALDVAGRKIGDALAERDYHAAMIAMAVLRAPLDGFFREVTVNAVEPELRLNRLRLLCEVRDTMDRIADFSKIEG